ncbi:hypothetical protein ZWY2020_016954 [Hordeum vulgare]|nr:hypothetical protein ZWY2020_016954 [Hordeum vulgare]
MAPPSLRAALENLTLADADALDCGVCYLPLKPPIFQCVVGHVLCSQCRDKLVSARSCHVCRAPMDGGYRRSHDMEKLVESIRAPCPNAAYGCAAKPAYYDLQPHIHACQHGPCHCPEEACGFVGFNVVDVVDLDGATKLLFLVMVSRESIGRAISAVCLRPRAEGDEPFFYGLQLEFDTSSRWYDDFQKSCFDVECTDLLNGMPHPTTASVPRAPYCSTI